MRSWMQPWSLDNDATLDYDALNKIDMISGRYNVPRSRKPLSVIADAIITAEEEGTPLEFVSTKHGSKVRDEFCDLLLTYVNTPLEDAPYTGVHLTTSGALAVEDAIKIAMQAKPGARTVISFMKSYHGASFGAGSCTGEERRQYVEKNTIGFVQVRNPSVSCVDTITDIKSIIAQRGSEDVACIVLEVVNTIHGLLHGNSDFFEDLQKICHENKILLIVDEVLTGFYRTAKRFAFMHYPIVPDMICFSKAVTNGQVPLGGVILHQDVRKRFAFTGRVFGVGSTYAGYPFGCAVATQSLLWLADAEEYANGLECEMYDARTKLMAEGIPCKQFGLLMSVEFKTPVAARQAKQLLANAKVIVDQHDQFIIMAPPFDLQSGMIFHVADLIKNIFKKVQ